MRDKFDNPQNPQCWPPEYYQSTLHPWQRCGLVFGPYLRKLLEGGEEVLSVATLAKFRDSKKKGFGGLEAASLLLNITTWAVEVEGSESEDWKGSKAGEGISRGEIKLREGERAIHLCIAVGHHDEITPSHLPY